MFDPFRLAIPAMLVLTLVLSGVAAALEGSIAGPCPKITESYSCPTVGMQQTSSLHETAKSTRETPDTPFVPVAETVPADFRSLDDPATGGFDQGPGHPPPRDSA